MDCEALPPPSTYKRAFVRLRGFWVTCEEAAAEASGGDRPASDGQCSFPGCIYHEKHSGPHGFDTALTDGTPKRKACIPTKYLDGAWPKPVGGGPTTADHVQAPSLQVSLSGPSKTGLAAVKRQRTVPEASLAVGDELAAALYDAPEAESANGSRSLGNKQHTPPAEVYGMDEELMTIKWYKVVIKLQSAQRDGNRFRCFRGGKALSQDSLPTWHALLAPDAEAGTQYWHAGGPQPYNDVSMRYDTASHSRGGISLSLSSVAGQNGATAAAAPSPKRRSPSSHTGGLRRAVHLPPLACEEASARQNEKLEWGRVYLRLNAWWETPATIARDRIWALEGLCGFPGCPLAERHSGPHQFCSETAQYFKS